MIAFVRPAGLYAPWRRLATRHENPEKRKFKNVQMGCAACGRPGIGTQRFGDRRPNPVVVDVPDSSVGYSNWGVIVICT